VCYYDFVTLLTTVLTVIIKRSLIKIDRLDSLPSHPCIIFKSNMTCCQNMIKES